MTTKHLQAQIVVDPKADLSLQRLTRNLSHGAPKIDLSAANMLSQLHGIAGMLLQEVQQTGSEPLAKRIGMAKDLAKLIPLLAQAERKVHKGWRGKDVEDMTDSELRHARRALKGAARPKR